MGRFSPDEARTTAQRLIRLRDEGHFEPSWLHAYGGRLDATLAVLEALTLAAPEAFTAEKRDALAWILSTRPSWNTWHVEAETAAALRALALVGAPPEEVASRVVVKLDGVVVRTAAIDPKDPFLSAASLAHLELGRHLPAGVHVVEVSYDGKLRPTASLVSRWWDRGTRGPVSSNGVTVAAKCTGRVRVDGLATLTLNITGSSIGGGSLILGPSGLLEVDYAALASRTGWGRPILGVRSTERGLELQVSPDAKSFEFAVPLRAVRRGSGRWPALAWVGRVDAEPRVIDPGDLVVE